MMARGSVRSILAAGFLLVFVFLFSFNAPLVALDSAMRNLGVIVSTAGCAFFMAWSLVQMRWDV